MDSSRSALIHSAVLVVLQGLRLLFFLRGCCERSICHCCGLRRFLDFVSIMKNSIFRVFVAALLMISTYAFADTVPAVKYYYLGVYTADRYESANGACAAHAPGDHVDVNMNCLMGNGAYAAMGQVFGVWACPSGSVVTGGAGQTAVCTVMCAPGEVKDDYGKCRPPCPAGEGYSNGLCRKEGRDGCAFGQHDDNTGGWAQCIDDCTYPKIEDSLGACILPACPEGSFRDENNECHVPACPPGQSRENGICVTPPPKPCPSGSTNTGTTANPICVVGDGGSGDGGDGGSGDGGDGGDGDGGDGGSGDGDDGGSGGSNDGGDGGSGADDGADGADGADGEDGGDGEDGVDGEDGEDGAGFCEENPTLSVCRDSAVSGIGCDGAKSTIEIDGDAIQGAILRKIADEECANYVEHAAKTLGQKLLDGADPMQAAIDAALAGSTVDLSGTALDWSGFLGGGSCLPDRSISFSGHSVAVSFSAICNNIAPLRFVILACSLIAAYLLVSKSVLQG